MSSISYHPLAKAHFKDVIALGNHVHGDNYLDDDSLLALYHSGIKNGINASWVAYDGDTIVGFRLTQAAGNWNIDKWCSPQLWTVHSARVCYFKCNTVDARYRGHGIGSEMLTRSIEKAREQGCQAGLAHIWLASPGNSAYRYFSKCGGVTVKEHPNKWQHLSIEDGYVCPVCGDLCTCTAAEMLLTFKPSN